MEVINNVPFCTIKTMDMGLYDDYKMILDKLIKLYYNDDKIEEFIIKRNTLESIITLNRDQEYRRNILKIMYLY